jgi:hypothetical protein
MNPRLKLALILHKGEKGFATVIAMGLGLVMILVGLTMAIRSQSDVALSSTQKVTSRALAAAEVGVSRYQYLLNTVRDLAKEDFNPTNLASTYTSTPSPSCPPSNINDGIIADIYAGDPDNEYWIPVDSTQSTNGQYKLISYDYTPTNPPVGDFPPPGTLLGIGKLTVKGRVNGNDNTSVRTSTAQLQVEIPVRQTDHKTVPVPGVWIDSPTDTDGTQNNTIAGNVLVAHCANDGTSSASSVQFPANSSYVAQYTSASIPDVPDQPATGVIPLSISSSVTLPRPARTETTGNGGNAVTIDLPADIPIPSYRGLSNVHVYSIAGDITDNSVTITVTPGEKVIIFLAGSVTGNGFNIDHTCGTTPGCVATNVQIFGTGTSGEICLNGNNIVEAFILAPKYTVGVAGSGNSGGFKGAIWADTWANGGSCGSNTSNIVLIQTADWDSIGLVPKNLPPYIDTPSSWSKKQVD